MLASACEPAARQQTWSVSSCRIRHPTLDFSHLDQGAWAIVEIACAPFKREPVNAALALCHGQSGCILRPTGGIGPFAVGARLVARQAAQCGVVDAGLVVKAAATAGAGVGKFLDQKFVLYRVEDVDESALSGRST